MQFVAVDFAAHEAQLQSLVVECESIKAKDQLSGFKVIAKTCEYIGYGTILEEFLLLILPRSLWPSSWQA